MDLPHLSDRTSTQDARDPAKSPAARAHLAEDSKRSVRLELALNPAASSYNLARIVDKETDWVPALIERFIRPKSRLRIFSAVANHPNANEDTLRVVQRHAAGTAAAERATERLKSAQAPQGGAPHTSRS